MSCRCGDIRRCRTDIRKIRAAITKMEGLRGIDATIRSDLSSIAGENSMYMTPYNIGNIAEISISKRENKKAGEEKTLEKLVKIEDGKNKEILSNKNLKESSNLYSEKKIVEGKLFKISKINNMSIFEFFLDSFKELFLNENVDIRVFYQKKENILTVPKQAVVLKNKKSYIYLIDKNNLVKEKEVLTGIDNGEKIEILGADIKEGMEIIGNPDEKIGNNVIVERKKIQDEELENKRRLEKLEKENEKLENRMNENEREIIRLKRKQ